MTFNFDSAISAFGWLMAGIVVRETPRIVMEHILLRKAKPKADIPNGNGLATSTRRDVREVFVDTLKADVLPMLTIQTEILKGIAETNKQMSDGIGRLVAIEESRRRR